MLPSTTLNTHLLTFRDSLGRDPLPITSKRAQAILAFLADPSKQSHFHVLDDNGKFKEAIPRSDIRFVKEIEKMPGTKSMKWICDCGQKNFMHVWPPENCPQCNGDRTEINKRLLLQMQSK